MRKCLTLIFALVSLNAHEVTFINALSTNREVAVGVYSFFVEAGGHRVTLSDVQPGTTISNTAWSLNVDDWLSLDEAQRLQLMLTSTNGVETVIAIPSYGANNWRRAGVFCALMVIGFHLAIRLVMHLKLPMESRE